MNDLGKRKQLARLVSRFIWILFVVFPLGCGPGADAVPSATVPHTQPVPSPTVTATARPSLTPSPTAIPFPVQVVYLGSSQLNVNPEFQALPAGIYILADRDIFEEASSRYRWTLSYVSFDGMHSEQVITDLDQELPYISRTSLRYMNGRPVVFGSDIHAGEITLVRIDIESGEVYTWHVTASSDVLCDTIASLISPEGRWLVSECIVQGRHYGYLVDLEEDTGKVISLPYECRNPVSSGGLEFYWTNENQLLTWCGTGYNRAYACLVSPQNGRSQCQQVNYSMLYGLSPYSSSVILRSEQTEEPYRRIFLTDLACLQNQQACDEIAAICNIPNWTGCGGEWDNTGQYLVWSATISTNLQDFSTNAYLVDLDAGSTETLFAGQPEYWSLIGYSPDNRWIAFNIRDDGIALISLDSRIVRRIQIDGSFLGWYIVP
ncbi:MAG: hypothetical protein ABIJ39_05720 [Chloroflexota bacterium]